MRSRRRKGEVGGSGVGPTARLEAEAEAEAAASEHATLLTPSPLTPRLPKARDAGIATTPCGLAPPAAPANDAPVVVHVTEGPGREPLEIRVHLPNGFPGQMPSGYGWCTGYGSRPPRPRASSMASSLDPRRRDRLYCIQYSHIRVYIPVYILRM